MPQETLAWRIQHDAAFAPGGRPMERSRHARDVSLMALTLAAGYLDAIGYLVLGGVFTANMTGNTVLLGLHLSQEQGAAVLRSVVALAGFGAGLLLGALVAERRRG
jgi:uncharacterized membrane protein YoaK (UPF0700 family)